MKTSREFLTRQSTSTPGRDSEVAPERSGEDQGRDEERRPESANADRIVWDSCRWQCVGGYGCALGYGQKAD